MRLALLFILVCVFCFLFVLSFLVWFFLWPPEEVLTLLFFLHHENGDFCILMKILSLEYFFSAESRASQAEYMSPLLCTRSLGQRCELYTMQRHRSFFGNYMKIVTIT